MTNKKTIPGIDIFLNQQEEYCDKKTGLVTNDAARTSAGVLSRSALLKKGFKIIRLFSPEHGISAAAPDGMAQQNSVDSITGLPVISLYGKNLLPAEKDIADLDCILFDISDTGARFYTYLWTLTYLMEACALYQKPLIILDRPNPIGGNIDQAEGPMLDELHCSSFIGRWNIPIRHSCTFGELTVYFKASKNIGAELNVIRIPGWNRHKPAGEEWEFVPTSPAISDPETAMLYPGFGILEGINVNEGRGTETPFKLMGTPWINSQLLLTEFEKLNLPGINAFSCTYTPEEGQYKNETCHGLRFSVTDFYSFRPVWTGLKLISLVMQLHPEQCRERLYKTAVNLGGTGHLDRLTGVKDSFQKIKSGEIFEKYYSTGNWKNDINPFLLY